MARKFEQLENEYPYSLILQCQGMFFNAFNNSAFVLSGLMDYKVRAVSAVSSTYKCGFPADCYEKVVDECKRCHINYVFFNKEEIIAEETFNDNQFQNFLKLYRKNENSENRVETQTEDKSDCVQKIVLMDGCGVNASEALASLKENLEKDILSNGFRIVSADFFEQDMGSSVLIKGLVVYEGR